MDQNSAKLSTLENIIGAMDGHMLGGAMQRKQAKAAPAATAPALAPAATDPAAQASLAPAAADAPQPPVAGDDLDPETARALMEEYTRAQDPALIIGSN